ncbi:hypothetical protein DPSP01_006066 [Paraphaeosphaeria sporulosa]
MQSRSPSPQDAVVELFVQIVEVQLTSEWTRKKIPNGLYEAYARAEVDEEESVNGIFRRASFRVWLAYWLASCGKHHFSGRTAQLRTFDTFNKLPNEKKQSAAETLAAIVPHPTVKDAIGKILARWRTLHPDLTPRETSPPRSTHLSVANSIATDPASTINGSRAQLQSNASMEATMAMIPHRTSSSIKKYLIEGQAKAGIQMTFPLRPTQLPCSITFEVEGNIIEDIASALFGVVVKSDEEIRYLYYPGGTEVFAYEGRFKLRNGKAQVIAELFGPEIATAVRTSPLFQQGMNEPDRTKCISMSISNDPRQAAFLSLSLGLAKGTLISAKLYP